VAYNLLVLFPDYWSRTVELDLTNQIHSRRAAEEDDGGERRKDHHLSLESQFGRQGGVFYTGTGVFGTSPDKATDWVH